MMVVVVMVMMSRHLLHLPLLIIANLSYLICMM